MIALLKIGFDEETWAQLEEYLKVAQLCGESAGRLQGFAKGVVQRTVATLGSEKDVSAPEAEHALTILATLHHSASDAAQGFASAASRVDALMKQLEPALGRPRTRQRG